MSAADDLLAAVASDDQGKALRAVRDDLARRLVLCESDRDYAALTARLTDVLARLAALPSAAKGTPLDELAAERARRGSRAARQARSAGTQ